MLIRPAVRAALLLMGVVALVACRPEQPADDAADAPDELVFGLSGEPDTLDPHATTGTLTFQVTRSLYDTLVEPDRDGTIVPALAREWSVDPEGLTWTFALRDDVVFHDGSTFDADDVVASVTRILSPEFASPSAFEYEPIAAVAARPSARPAPGDVGVGMVGDPAVRTDRGGARFRQRTGRYRPVRLGRVDAR